MMTYNHAAYIRQAIEGVLMQNVKFSWDFIIADDHSTDGTREILLEYKQKYPDLITLILQKENVGAAQNWMDLIATPKGKYVAYFEGDDYWCDQSKLQKQIDFLESNHDYSICFHQVYELTDDGKMQLSPLNTSEEEETYSILDLAKNNFIHTPSVVFRNDLKREFPLWFKNSPVGDYALHMLNAKHGLIKYMPQPMAVYRRHGSSSWSSLLPVKKMEKWLLLLDYLSKETFEPEVHKILVEQKRRCKEKYLKMLMKDSDWNTFLQKLSEFSDEDTYISKKWLLEYYPQYIQSLKASGAYRFAQTIRSYKKKFIK